MKFKFFSSIFLLFLFGTSFFMTSCRGPRPGERPQKKEKVFRMIDTERDFYLSAEEYQNFVSNYLEKLDEDQDGKITYEEVRFKKSWLGKVKKRKRGPAFVIPGIPLQENDQPAKINELKSSSQKWFQDSDGNQDKRLSEPEFFEATKDIFPKPKQGRRGHFSKDQNAKKS